MATTLLPRDVRQALALLHANSAGEHTIAALAAACRVAPRTLQKHFQQFVGRSPLEVLRDIRLDLVRAELLRARADTSITELATRSGFAHFGRFAGYYRDRFGESPSATRRRERHRPDAWRAPSLALPLANDRPVVAVLPFRVAGPAEHHAGDLAEELAMALASRRSVIVGAPADARYHVHGRVQANEAGQSRIIVRLLDAATARCLWADAWNGEPDDAFAFEQRVAQRIATKFQSVLRDAETERACRKEPEELTAWELTMRALARAVLLEPKAQTEALELAERAMELAPFDPLPLAVAAWCHGMRAGHNFTTRPAEERAAACMLAERAARLRARDPIAEALLASAYTLAHDLGQAELHVDRALALDGGCAWAWQRSGWIKVYRGEPAAAIDCFQIGCSLDPSDPLGFLSSIGIAAANFEGARYAEAARWFRRGIEESPSAIWANRYLAAAYALSGRENDARTSLAALNNIYPDWTIAQVRSALPHTASFTDRAANGLEAIGMRL